MMPVIPHFSNECIELLEDEREIEWPKIDEKFLIEENINFVVQINGKKRGLIKVNRDISEDDIIKLVKENNEINKYIKNQELKKKIFVPNKLINIII
jgi:leucyl-tRNA synthetase